MPPKKRAAKKTAAPAKKAAPRKVQDEEELDELEQTPDSSLVGSGEPLTAVFDIERETPGTVRFKERTEEGELPITRVLYVQKSAFRQLGEPGILTVTYTPGE